MYKLLLFDYIEINEHYFKFRQDEFLNLDNVLKEEVLFYLLKKYQYSKGFIDELIKDIGSNKRSFVLNYKDISLVKDKNEIKINHFLYKAVSTNIEIKDFGKYRLNDDYDISFEKVDNIEKNNVHNIGSINIIWYNSNMFPFLIRNRLDGDKMKLSKGHKKVKDILIDMQVSQENKDKALVLLDKNNDIISILNLKKSDIIKNMDKYDLKIEITRRMK